MKYNCALTTDCVVFKGNAAVLIRRGNPPYKGSYALPGGFVEDGEIVDDACKREAWEETGLELTNLRLIGAYATPGRDPRGRTVTFAFLADADLSQLKAGDDAASVELVEDWEKESLAFDHMAILQDAKNLFRS